MTIENRNIVTSIILTIVTCGIYGIIWAWKMAKDAVKVKDVNDDGTLEAVLTIFIPCIGFFLTERKFAEGCQEKGIPHSDNSILYLVLALFGLGIVDYCLMQSELNKIADAGYVFDAPVPPFVNYAPPQDDNQDNV